MTDRRSGLRQIARGVFDETLRDADAGLAVRRALDFDGDRLKIFDAEFDLRARGPDERPPAVYSVALGKAAGAMAHALDEILGEHLGGGVVSAGSLGATLSTRWRVFVGGHPLPNRASLEAARAAFALLRRAEAEALYGSARPLAVFLVSGGGSAMLESPRDPDVTLEDLRAMNGALVGCGASIREINAVRRAVSSVKGGGLARAAPHCAHLTLIVSDVNAGDERSVASGPTFVAGEEADARAALAVVERYGLAQRLPASVLRSLDGARGAALRGRGRDFDARAPRRHFVLTENGRAVERAAGIARSLGFAVEVAGDLVEQHVEEGALALVSRLFDLRKRIGGGRAVCVVSGGEFSCPVRGEGRGGRNSETALRCAVELSKQKEAINGCPRVVALCAGTDGIDGNSPSAGAICDEKTIARALSLGLDAHAFLERSDSHSFFAALGDTIDTGPTGTNVRDLRILMAKDEG